MNTEALIDLFGLIGFVVVTGFVIVMIYCAFDALRRVIRQWRWNYKYKHRFDKPPTAACYCVDCKWHLLKDSRCRYTPDNGFCYEAEPRKKDDDKAR